MRKQTVTLQVHNVEEAAADYSKSNDLSQVVGSSRGLGVNEKLEKRFHVNLN